jgi:hypothetical protein
MNRSVNLLKMISLKNNFLNEVLDNPDLIPEFKITKLIKEKNTVSRMSLHFLLQTQQYLMHENQLKINLDTNIQIKMDFINPESADM